MYLRPFLLQVLTSLHGHFITSFFIARDHGGNVFTYGDKHILRINWPLLVEVSHLVELVPERVDTDVCLRRHILNDCFSLL